MPYGRVQFQIKYAKLIEKINPKNDLNGNSKPNSNIKIQRAIGFGSLNLSPFQSDVSIIHEEDSIDKCITPGVYVTLHSA